ncbi:MAG TPA: antibiotic biosynthesis monooxygenase, partial [Spirochaetia bacterium]|nr:antibiotic biosynthesis monooxygenase [Spirochaetia bacterium]
FVSAALHRSLDGKRVINYAQWQRAEDWQALARQGAELFSRFRGVASSDPHLYDVVYLSAAAKTAHVTIERASPLTTMINVFNVEPEKQEQLIDIWLEEGKKFEAWPGFVSAALHRSLDGKRVINYAQWQKAEDWQALARQGAELFARFRGVGASDPHLYEVVYLSKTPRRE